MIDIQNLPESIIYLKMSNNPFCEDVFYRKAAILHLPLLDEFDRIKVVAAERMTYMGLITNVDVPTLLEKYEVERQEQDARDKMEAELYTEMMEERGLKNNLEENLEKFGQLSEFTILKEEVA